MRKLKALVICVILVAVQAVAESGLDEICDIYASHEYSGESVGELWFILGDRVTATITDVPALEIYSALNVASPCSRYELFQEVAQEQLSRDWQCLEMSSLLNAAKPERCESKGAGEERNPFNQLCVIYEEELSGKSSPGPMTFQRLANRVDREVPELSDQFSHLANFSKADFYPALKEMAERHSGSAWDCSFIERRYKGR